MHLGFATIVATVSTTSTVAGPTTTLLAALALATAAALAILATPLALVWAPIIATLRLLGRRGMAVSALGCGLCACLHLVGRSGSGGSGGLGGLVLARVAIAIVAAPVVTLATLAMVAARTPDVLVFDLGFCFRSRRLGRGG